jgi:hypothetical protein
MLTITQQPNEIVQSKNPVIFKIQTDNYVLTQGVNAVYGFIGFDSPNVGDTLTLQWDSKTVVFTFATALDSSGLKIRTNTGGLDYNDYVSNILLQDIRTNNDLYSDFIIEVGINTYFAVIIFTARNTGTKYNLTITSTVSGFSTISPTFGVDKTVRDNFKIFIDLYLIDNNITYANPQLSHYAKIVSLEQIPDSSNICTFDLSSFLDDYVIASKPSDPSKNIVSGINYSTKTALKYFIRYGESYNNPSENFITLDTSSSPKYICRGGVEKFTFPSYSFYTDAVTNKRSLLTTQPDTRYITLNTYAWLYFLCLSSNGGPKLYVKTYYSDNTTQDGTITSAYTYQNKYNVIILPVGYNALKDAGMFNSAKTLVKYEVTCYDSTVTIPLSQTITYIIDSLNYEYERLFKYENSRGGFDILRCVGPQSVTSTYDFDEAIKTTPAGYTSDFQEEVTFNNTKKEIFKISTGFQTKATIQSYEDFFLSKNVFLINNQNKYIPVKVTSKKTELPGDLSDTFAIAFEYEYAFTDLAYSNI